MKRIFLILCFLISYICHADGGYSYRFSVNTTLVNTKQIEGYIYVYSWDKYEYNGNFREFLIKNSTNDELKIYPYITTVNNQSVNFDFALIDSSLAIKINEIESIKKSDYLLFYGGNRLQELSEKQFNLIQISKPFSHYMNAYELSEYCHLLFLNWQSSVDEDLANQFYKKLEIKKRELGSLEGNNGPLFYNYVNKLKDELNNLGLLLIMYCES